MADTLSKLGTVPTCLYESENERYVVTMGTSPHSSITSGATISLNTVNVMNSSFELAYNVPGLSVNSRFPDSSIWDIKDENSVSITLVGMESVTEVISWSNTGPGGNSIFTEEVTATNQTWAADSLELGSYDIGVIVTFTDATWLTYAHTFSTEEVVFSMSNPTEDANKFTFPISYGGAISITSCADLFTAPSVTLLGGITHSLCTYTTGLFSVYASGEHNLPGELTFNQPITPNTYTVITQLPDISFLVDGGDLWEVDSANQIVLAINILHQGSLSSGQFTYIFEYVSGGYATFIYPALDNISTNPPNSLAPGIYVIKGCFQLPSSFNNYKRCIQKSMTVTATISAFVQNGPRFIFTINAPFPDTISHSCISIVDSTILGNNPKCIRHPSNTNILIIYAGSSATIDSSTDIELLPANVYVNNNKKGERRTPEISSVDLENSDKHWNRGVIQRITTNPGYITDLGDLSVVYVYTMKNSDGNNTVLENIGKEASIRGLEYIAGNYSLDTEMRISDNFNSVKYRKTINGITMARTPKPVVSGLNASYPNSMEISLRTRDSVDMDTGTQSEDLKYTWNCYTDILLSLPCGGWVAQTTPNVTLSSMFFSPGIYYIDLLLTKWTYFQSHQHGLLNITNNGLPLELQLQNPTPTADTGTSFTALTPDLNSIVTWSLSPTINRRYQKRNILTIPPDSFIPGGLYSVSCIVSPGERRRELEVVSIASEVTINLKVAKTIEMVGLKVTPRVGIAFTDPIKLEAYNWSDPDLDELEYRFGYRVIGTTAEIYFRQWNSENIVDGITEIPPGMNMYLNFVEITVQAKTTKNATATLRQNITVRSPLIPDKNIFAYNRLAAAGSNSEDILAAVASLAFLTDEEREYVTSDVCGGCNTKHGVCDLGVKICVCDPPYSHSVYCQIPNEEIGEMDEVSLKLAMGIIYIYIYIIFSIEGEHRRSKREFGRDVGIF